MFDIQIPITAGTSVCIQVKRSFKVGTNDRLQVELFHHSRDVPASISRLISVLDRSNGSVVKNKPRYAIHSGLQDHHVHIVGRVLTKGMSAEVEISLRSATYSGPASRVLPIPLEPFSVNKDMGRILVRRGGETIGAGKSSCPTV